MLPSGELDLRQRQRQKQHLSVVPSQAQRLPGGLAYDLCRLGSPQVRLSCRAGHALQAQQSGHLSLACS